MSGWSERENDSSNSQNFLRLKDKESVKGVFRGEPKTFYTHWNGKHSIECVGKDKCENCKRGEKARFRFRVNFITKEGNDKDGYQYVSKIFEQGPRAYDDIVALIKEGFDLNKQIISISRSGTSLQDTKYKVMPSANGVIDEKMENLIKEVPLQSLAFEKPKQEESAPDYVIEDIPF